jgi:four helix bundle protein
VFRAPSCRKKITLGAVRTVKSYRDLHVWQRADAAVLDVYRVTSLFPRSKQLLRCAAYSIPANIAEGFGRRSTKELLQFLAIANGSFEQLRYFLSLSCDLRYLALAEPEKLEMDLKAVAQIITALAESLRLRLAARAGSSDSSRNTAHVTRTTKTPSEGLH